MAGVIRATARSRSPTRSKLRIPREACSLTEVLEAAKTKRYPYARLRRMVLWAYLGLTEFPEKVPYRGSPAAAALCSTPRLKYR